jgi:pimeloyl-ACP methyl ester carboxylesterase
MRRVVLRAFVAVGMLAVAAGAFTRYRLRGIPRAVRGIFPNGMAYARWGTGPRTLLWIVGGPGVGFPTGLRLATIPFVLRPFAESGYTAWIVDRKRNMPKGYTIPDMAEDYAGLIADEFDGKVDLVLGEDYGGMIGYYLAARHPDRLAYLAHASVGYRVSEQGKTIDHDFARLLSEGRTAEAFALLLSVLAPNLRLPGVARALGAVIGRLFIDKTRPYFSKEVHEETARLIPDCTLRIYEGKGDAGAVSDRRLSRDVLDFVRQRSRDQAACDAERPTVIGQPTVPTDPLVRPAPSPVGSSAG